MVSTDQLQIATIVHNALFNTDSVKLQSQAFSFVADDCEFINPIVHTFNKVQLQSTFSSLTKMSPTTTVHAITSASKQVMIDCTVTYNTMIPFSIRHVTKMSISSGKVSMIEDVWSVQDLVLGVPVIGRIYQNAVLPLMGKLFSQWGNAVRSE